MARDLPRSTSGSPYTVPVRADGGQVDPKLSTYVGQYELRPDFIMTVTREGNRIFTQATGQGKIEVFPGPRPGSSPRSWRPRSPS